MHKRCANIRICATRSNRLVMLSNGRLTHRYKNGASFDVRDVVTKTFDAAERVKTQTDAEGNTTAFTYDEAGNPGSTAICPPSPQSPVKSTVFFSKNSFV